MWLVQVEGPPSGLSGGDTERGMEASDAPEWRGNMMLTFRRCAVAVVMHDAIVCYDDDGNCVFAKCPV